METNPKEDRTGPSVKAVLTEITGCRLNQKAINSFRGGERGFWMVMWDVSAFEVRASGVCLDESSEPCQLMMFRDSAGLVAKFVYGTPAVTGIFIERFGGEVKE